MSRDSGSYDETKRVISEIESRESGANSAPPPAKLKAAYTGGKTLSTEKNFMKPSVGKVRMRRGME